MVDGQEVKAGDPIVDGPRDPKELMEIKGVRETQLYLVEEVQKVYRDQGVSIHDKHIELIVRQMTRRIGVQEPGDTDFLPGERVDQKVFREMNKTMVEAGERPAEGRPELMGITKASLATDSWLSAASFQETTRVLTEAAIDGRGDNLVGLKENIIIGKLIPAGTGMPRYREFDVDGAGLPADGVLLVGRGRPGRVAGQHLGVVQLRRRRRRRRRGLVEPVVREGPPERAAPRSSDPGPLLVASRCRPVDQLPRAALRTACRECAHGPRQAVRSVRRRAGRRGKLTRQSVG